MSGIEEVRRVIAAAVDDLPEPLLTDSKLAIDGVQQRILSLLNNTRSGIPAKIESHLRAAHSHLDDALTAAGEARSHGESYLGDL
ncbi:hypothetical protein [Phytomonospora endophytica]|uniref:Rho-GAP domain-containing protein n=1 Tax=Phytomonospora endophytica TaxID=714109 RepID=A0A841FQ12_9ACTN|nr:hypothetical protein [Phytomonospora endophytica]MBB6038215.1 hypothetical protein [Phytomonospora endophytica]GIG67327.1 hypothetical protein Pen01_36220 [Phytomonospora endophytica]